MTKLGYFHWWPVVPGLPHSSLRARCPARWKRGAPSNPWNRHFFLAQHFQKEGFDALALCHWGRSLLRALHCARWWPQPYTAPEPTPHHGKIKHLCWSSTRKKNQDPRPDEGFHLNWNPKPKKSIDRAAGVGILATQSERKWGGPAWKQYREPAR